MLAGHRLGFQAVVSHGVPLSRGRGDSVIPRAPLRGASRSRSLYPMGAFASQPETTPPPWPVVIGVAESVRIMSQLSKVKHSRNQWKHKAKQRGDRDRYQRKQIARITAERDRAIAALKEAQARLRQFANPNQALVARPKGELVFLALQLFLVARIGFRAVSRVLSLLAWTLGLKKAPCPQTIINWVMRLVMVRIDSARLLRGVPLRLAPFSNGLIWMIDISIGLGTGKIVAVLAF